LGKVALRSLRKNTMLWINRMIFGFILSDIYRPTR
jgi:hypothetical protein